MADVEGRELVRIVSKTKEILSNLQDNEMNIILESLENLERIHITLSILKESQIGSAVRVLRKHDSKIISDLARSLIEKWKNVVREHIYSNNTVHAANEGCGAHFSQHETGTSSIIKVTEKTSNAQEPSISKTLDKPDLGTGTTCTRQERESGPRNVALPEPSSLNTRIRDFAEFPFLKSCPRPIHPVVVRARKPCTATPVKEPSTLKTLDKPDLGTGTTCTRQERESRPRNVALPEPSSLTTRNRDCAEFSFLKSCPRPIHPVVVRARKPCTATPAKEPSTLKTLDKPDLGTGTTCTRQERESRPRNVALPEPSSLTTRNRDCAEFSFLKSCPRPIHPVMARKPYTTTPAKVIFSMEPIKPFCFQPPSFNKGKKRSAKKEIKTKPSEPSKKTKMEWWISRGAN